MKGIKPGDVVRFAGAATYGIVLQAGSLNSYVDLMFAPDKWIGHTLATHDLVVIPEKLVPDEVLARRAARILLGLDNLVRM